MRDDGVEVYETLGDEESFEEIVEPEKSNNPDIYSAFVSPEDAVKSFLGRKHESLDDRIARIRREIEEIKAEAPPDLLSELHSAFEKPAPRPSETDKAPQLQVDRVDASNEFSALEKRVDELERKLGTSYRVPKVQVPLADSIARMQSLLTMLSTDPELVKRRFTELRQIPKNIDPSTSEKIDWIYARLHTLDSQLQLLPNILSRLQTLRHFHAETLDSNEQIKAISESLSVMRRETKDWTEVLTHLSTNFI